MPSAKDDSWRGKAGRPSEPEMIGFLGEGQLGCLGVLDENGWPYVAPVWFEYGDGGYCVIPRARSRQAEYLRRDVRVSRCIDDPAMRKVMVQGERDVIETPNVGGLGVGIAKRMPLRYPGEHGPDDLVPTLLEPHWLSFIRPLATTWQGVDRATKYKHSRW